MALADRGVHLVVGGVRCRQARSATVVGVDPEGGGLRSGGRAEPCVHPTHRSTVVVHDAERGLPFVVDLNKAAVEALPASGVVYDPTTFYARFDTSLLAALREREVPIVVRDPILVRQLGESRRANGTEPVLEIVTGVEAVDHRRDRTTVAFVSERSAEELVAFVAGVVVLFEALSRG